MVRHEKRVTSNILLALLLEGEDRGEGGAPIMPHPSLSREWARVIHTLGQTQDYLAGKFLLGVSKMIS